MPSIMRTEVYYSDGNMDGRAKKWLRRLSHEFSWIEDLALIDVYITEEIGEASPALCRHLFSDTVSQDAAVIKGETGSGTWAAESGILGNWNVAFETAYKPGVTDPVALTVRKTLELELGKRLGKKALVQTARQFLLKGKSPEGTSVGDVLKMAYNPLIQQVTLITREEWDRGERFPLRYPLVAEVTPPETECFDLLKMGKQDLRDLSSSRLLALTLEEMESVREYFCTKAVHDKRREHGMPGNITDVELEMIAQTWSEHCKHKIFQAEIEYSEGETRERIVSLFDTYIRGTTEKIAEKRPFLRSVFHDNSGVIAFDEDTLLCFKAETHNSPSALDPYGGAITGIVGVNRDIIGTGKGAKPLFNTNVLCFGEPDTPETSLPEGLMHPVRVLEGVHHGIIDGGNQSGIPVVAGGVLFDDSFTGKPLVFCGTGGILPAEIDGEGAWIQHIHPGDLAVMVGGRIGKDGIHGATFSSLALDEASPTSAVQIGDPITQKNMLDFLLEARDLGLYSGITDNGAGGLSSSLGEMAEASGGVRINLDLCPLKYEGLAPWEILVSESQERMSLAVPESSLDDLLSLAAKRDVEAAAVGRFTDSGFVEVTSHDKYLVLLSLDFLHNGLPRMDLKARWEPPDRQEQPLPERPDLSVLFLRVLGEPNVASKEHLVRQYDHEVKGHSIVKPFVGVNRDAPSDGAVLKPRYDSDRGITVTHGICPRYSDLDTYHMAACAVDEAFRAHIALGGDPELACGLDNFCWPDPVESGYTPDGQYKLAQLVRACRGLSDTCRAYGIPLISGKDSMKNDTVLGGRKVSVRPTLLVSLMGIIGNVKNAVTSDFKNTGDIIFVLGHTRGELGGTILEKVLGRQLAECPKVDTETALARYSLLHRALRRGLVASCHDISDGGLAVALAESALGGGFGVDVDILHVQHGEKARSDLHLLFCETPSRFVVSVKPEYEEEFVGIMGDTGVFRIGLTSETSTLRCTRGTREILNIPLRKIETAWKSLEHTLEGTGRG